VIELSIHQAVMTPYGLGKFQDRCDDGRLLVSIRAENLDREKAPGITIRGEFRFFLFPAEQIIPIENPKAGNHDENNAAA
jgi:hypothetical protein